MEGVESKGKKRREGRIAIGEERIDEMRGRGLLIGMQGNGPVKQLIEAARQGGLIVISAGEEVLRICPPLTISPEEIDAGLQVLAENWNMLGRVDGD